MVVMDEWMKAAIADDGVIAEFLVNLKQSGAKSRPELPSQPPTTTAVLKWGAKKRRTRPAAASRAAAVVSARKKKDVEEDAEGSTRCSPTTPLSWSGGTSPSAATADGCDESRSLTNNTAARSKATATSEYTGNSASTKKCRRKKTFAELQEEESSLLKERIYLTKEIATINATYKAQRARNESLKRMKLDLGSIPNCKPDSTPNELLRTIPNQSKQTVAPSRAEDDPQPPQVADSEATRTESTRSVFLLPDLNMTPSDGDFFSDDQCAMS